MEHVVFFPSADGAPAFRRVASIEDAVRFVEHLRNVEEVSDFSVCALTPVPLSMRTYYKVQVPTDDVAPDEPEEPAVPSEVGEPVAAAAGQKSLGFFAR